MESNEIASVIQSSNPLDDVGTWQRFQTIYHKITGKKEQLIQSYTEPYQINFKDLEDLHHRILQAAEPYPVQAHNENVTVVYNDNSSPVHSSFVRFKAQHDIGSTAIKSITLEYNFAINTTQSNNVNSYKISVDIISGLAVFAEIQQEVPKMFWQGIRYKTGKATIDYVDFAIAQNFMGVIKTWFAGRDQAPKRKVLDWIQEKSHLIPRLTKFIFLAVGTYAVVGSLNEKVVLTSNQEFAGFILIGGALLLAIIEFGWMIGKTIERSVDQIWKLSYIKLNQGDSKLIEEVRNHNKSCGISISYKVASFIFFASVSVLLKDLISHLV